MSKNVSFWTGWSHRERIPLWMSHLISLYATQVPVNGQSRFVGMEWGWLDWISRGFSFQSTLIWGGGVLSLCVMEQSRIKHPTVKLLNSATWRNHFWLCVRVCVEKVWPPGFLIKYVNCPQTPNLQIRNYVNCKLTDKY